MAQFASKNNNGKKRKRKHASAAIGKAPSPKCQLRVGEDDETFTMVHPEGDNNPEDVSNDGYDSDNSLEQYSDDEVEDMENVIDADININKSAVSDDNNTNEGDGIITKHAPPTPSTIAAKADDIFCRDYVVDPPILHLKPVSETLACTLTTWCRVPPKKDEVKDMFKASLVPINVEGLHPVCINDSLYRKLPMTAKINDQRLWGINTFLARGTGPLAEIFNDFFQIEAGLKYTSEKLNIQINNKSEIVVDGLTIDFPGFCCLLGRSICLLTAAHSNILQHRKVSLRTYIDKKFHYLTRESNPVTTLLLGNDLEQKISNSVRTSDAARCLTYRLSGCRNFSRNRRPFFGSNSYRLHNYNRERLDTRFRRDTRGHLYWGQHNFRQPRHGQQGSTRGHFRRH